MAFALSDDLIFPHPAKADPEDGLLAVGGDLTPERILLAYRYGIFPWYGEGYPILWWSPDPRLVLFPEEIRITKSMRHLLRPGTFEWTWNRNFAEVMLACGEVSRPGQDGEGWIHDEMLEAYLRLHRLGHAHSLEVWQEGRLVGGLYGIWIDRVFFGESMFHEVPNASKFALITLARQAPDLGFRLIDCQQDTPHLRSLGARVMPRSEFLGLLKEYVRK